MLTLKRTLCILFLLSLISCKWGLAQDLQAPSDIRLVIEDQDTRMINPLVSIAVDSSQIFQSCLVFLKLPPENQNQQILIKVGKAEGGNDIFDGIFDLSSEKELPNAQSIKQVGDRLIIRLGKFPIKKLHPGPIYATVMLFEYLSSS